MARGPVIRRLRPARFRRSRKRHSVDVLTVRIAMLVSERQNLRGAGAPTGAIERNRLAIARAQWELAHALIEQNLPESAPATRTAA
jgi:hypothetical protein